MEVASKLSAILAFGLNSYRFEIVAKISCSVDYLYLQSLLISFEDKRKIDEEIKIYVVNAGWGNKQPILLVTEFAQLYSLSAEDGVIGYSF